MKKFRCTVTRVDEYVIELDETKMTPEWMAEFTQTMYDFETLDEHAKHLAQHRSRFPDQTFFEGYGVPRINGEVPYGAHKSEVDPGINIRVISEDSDIEVEVEEE